MIKRKILFLTLTCIIMLTGCKKEEVTQVTTIETQQEFVAVNCTWDNITFEPLTPTCAFEDLGTELKIFPEVTSANHILVKKIVYNNNNLVELASEGSNDYISTDNYKIVTMINGNVLGYHLIDENYAYAVVTDTLSSSYVQEVLDIIVNQVHQ